MYDRKALAARMAKARFAAQDRYGRNLSYSAIGEMVERELGGEIEYSASSIKRYFDAEVTRVSVQVLLAYARVCGVPPGWLAFGDERDAGEIPAASPKISLPIGQRGTTSRAAKRGRAG
jgi:hypothetical protein